MSSAVSGAAGRAGSSPAVGPGSTGDRTRLP
ncbi:hypothetical protein ABH920_008766 [Catenulispora sp. EB89]